MNAEGCGCAPCVASAADATRSPCIAPRPALQEEAPTRELPRASQAETDRLVRLVGRLVERARSRTTLHERLERRGQDGRAAVNESGSPLVWHPEFGTMMLVDDEDAVRDGFVVSREDATWSDGDGVRLVTRLAKRPLTRATEAQVPWADEQPDRQALRAGLEREARRLADAAPGALSDLHRLRGKIRVRPQGPEPRVPARCTMIAPRPELEKWCAVTRHIAAGRRRLRRGLRRRWASALIAQVERAGGQVLRHTVEGLHELEVELPVAGWHTLCEHRDVLGVRWAAEGAVANSLPAPAGPALTDFACTGTPTRALGGDPDVGGCEEPAHFGRPWGSSRRLVLNAQAYLDAGYDGAGASAAGGLASWNTLDELEAGRVQSVPHVTLLVLDLSPDPHHPAFRSALGEYRVRCDLRDGKVVVGAAVEKVPSTDPSAPDATHGTRVAGAAAGSIEAGQDPRVPVSVLHEYRAARSGVAPRALLAFAKANFEPVELALSVLPFIGPTGEDAGAEAGEGNDYGYSYVQRIDGADVLACSMDHSNDRDVTFPVDGVGDGHATADLKCPTGGAARGTDAEAMALTYLAGEHSLLCVIAAGNQHSAYNDDIFGAFTCASGSGREMTSPASSPAALSVGAHGFTDPSCATMQQSDGLDPYTSGATRYDDGRTPDGRTYPLLVAASDSCGVATLGSGAAGSADNYKYGFFSGTSSSAPGVAGCAVLFKQWYLHHHGADTANQYGRLMSNLLNMADGFATDQRARGGKRVPVPAATWGLGRLRMRLYANEGMSSPWFRATKAVTLTHAGDHDIFDLGHPDTLEVPRGASRLRVTLWWLDVNTGSGESKAQISAHLSVSAGPDEGFGELKSSNGDNVIRFQYDCSDDSGVYGPVPRGRVHLLLVATAMPTEVRYPQRSHRTVYVSWFWESGPDLSLMDCGDRPNCLEVDAARLRPAGVDVAAAIAAVEAVVVQPVEDNRYV